MLSPKKQMRIDIANSRKFGLVQVESSFRRVLLGRLATHSPRSLCFSPCPQNHPDRETTNPVRDGGIWRYLKTHSFIEP
jgi:hypothetical protein